MSQAIWVVRAGKDRIFLQDFLEKNIVAIGWGEIGDLAHVHGREAINALLKQHFTDYTKSQLAINTGQIHRFRDELVQGFSVVTYDPGDRLYHFGVITGEYKFRPDLTEGLRHTRSVDWTGTIKRDDLTPETKNSLGAISTIFCISEDAAKELRNALRGEISVTAIPAEKLEIVQEAEIEVRKDTEQRALEFLQDRLAQLVWDDMQELVAGLLRAMGYKTRVSPPGPDRGRDIVASPDGFGFQTPRIVVEVKHRKGTMGAPEIRAFIGGLRHNDNGLYVSTGGFSREARYEADRANHHVELMDAIDLGRAIVEHYDQMDTETRTLLPLKKIYWPA